MAYKDKNDPRAKESRLKWYRENKDKQLSKQKLRKQTRAKFLKRWKSTQKCRNCDIPFKNQEYLCDLHHIEDKKDNIGQMMTYSMQMLKTEIRKCIPLCANCHRHAHKGDLY